jgi:hypothetical protein
MADAIWLVMQDVKLYQKGNGPNEIDLVGWGRDFTPVPMRLALTGKAPKDLPPTVVTFAPGIVSYVDTEHDLKWVNRVNKEEVQEEIREDLKTLVERLVVQDPSITKPKLVEETGSSEWEVRHALKELGYQRGPGGKKGATQWTKQKADSALQVQS